MSFVWGLLSYYQSSKEQKKKLDEYRLTENLRVNTFSLTCSSCGFYIAILSLSFSWCYRNWRIEISKLISVLEEL